MTPDTHEATSGSMTAVLSGRRSRYMLARTVSSLILVAVLAGAGMLVASKIANGGRINLSTHLYPFPVAALVFALFGLLILRKHSRHTVGWLVLFVAFMAGLHFLVNSYIAYDEDILLHNADTALHVAILLNHIVWWPVQVVPFSLILLYFPDGRLPSPRWRIVAVTTVIGLSLGMLTGFHPGPNEGWGITEPNPAGIPGSERLLENLEIVYAPMLLFGTMGSFGAVALRFRRARGAQREQLKWIVLAGLLALGLVTAVYAGYLLLPDRARVLDILYNLPTLLIFFIPITSTIAIVRHKLWDIDVIISRTLIYAGLTTLLILIYLAVVSILGSLFQPQTNALSSLVAAGVIAVLFQPLRDYLQRRVYALLFGERNDPAAVLTRLAHHAVSAEASDAILPNLAQTIARALRLPHVAIWLPASVADTTAVALVGEAPEQTYSLPLTYQQETIGHLVLAPRTPGDRFSEDEKALLATIAALTAITVRAVQLSAELGRSRRRIVTAREAERRRLRRDLHDGLGPQLASQTLGLDAVARFMATDPEKALSLLNSLKAQSQEAIRDVRRLVHGLRPPALDDLGLSGALRQFAARYESSTLRITLDVPAAQPELPAAVETAVYRIVQEAMTNVVRHASATLCVVRLVEGDGLFTVEVRDDGRGLPGDLSSGVGLQAMKERTAELNGQFVLESLPGGGTLVQARLPLETPDE